MSDWASWLRDPGLLAAAAAAVTLALGVGLTAMAAPNQGSDPPPDPASQPFAASDADRDAMADYGLDAPDGDPPGASGGLEVRRGIELRPAGEKSRAQLFYERLIARVEPDLVGRPDRLGVYLALFKRELIEDPRLFAFDVEARWDAAAETVVLEGFAEYAEHPRSLAAMLGYLGFERVEDRTVALPVAELGDARFALVTAAGTKLYSSPTGRRETVTEQVMGDALVLLRPAEAGYYYCHGADGYLGYGDGADIRRVAAGELEAYRGGAMATLLRDVPNPGHPAGVLPVGAVLRVTGAGEGGVELALPDGASASVQAQAVRLETGSTPAPVEAAIATAHQVLGTPYVWGGKTSQGVDCSGMVQIAFQSQGVYLPRDADQQAQVGKMTATRAYRGLMQRGDLMFFLGSRGTINHVAIYLGDGAFIESAGPGVQLGSLDPESTMYNERRDRTFCFARRLLR